MSQLPLLVEHGAVVWQVGIGLGALVGLVGGRLVRRRAEHRRVSADVAVRASKVTAPVLARAEGELTITGTLHGGVATTLVVANDPPGHDRPGEMWIDYRGDRIDLTGPIHVARGTTAVSTLRFPSAAPSTIVRKRGRRVHRMASLRDGDTVIVTGTLASTQGVDRFGRRRWVLNPSPGASAIDAIALAPAVRGVPLGALLSLAIAVVFGGATYLGEYQLGQWALARAEKRAGGPALGITDPRVLASAMPGSRDRALQLIAAP